MVTMVTSRVASTALAFPLDKGAALKGVSCPAKTPISSLSHRPPLIFLSSQRTSAAAPVKLPWTAISLQGVDEGCVKFSQQ